MKSIIRYLTTLSLGAVLALSQGSAFAQTKLVFNSDGMGHSAPVAANPLPDAIKLTGYGTENDATQWPTGFTKGNDAFSGGVYDGNGNVWMIPNSADRVLKVNTTTGDMVGYDSWPTGFTKGSWAFPGGVYDGNGNIWMIPLNADRVIKINTTTGAMTGYDSWPTGFTKGDNAFNGGVYDGNGNIWMIPLNADRVVKINTSTGAMTGYDSWPTGFTKGGAGFTGGAFDGRYIWMAPRNATQIVRVDTVDGSMKAYNQWSDMSGYTKGSSAFIGGVFDGENVWMIPSSANRVVKISSRGANLVYNGDGLGHSAPVAPYPLLDDVKLTGYGTASDSTQWPAGVTVGVGNISAFVGGVYDGNGNIWMIPLGAESVVKISTSSGAMTELNSWPTGFTKTGEAFYGGVYDGNGNVWMIPWSADRVIKINTSTGAMTGYNSWPTGYTKGAAAFGGGVYDGNGNIWMIPTNADRVIKINTTTGAMTGYNSWPTGFTKGGNAFVGSVYDGSGNVWMIPHTADRVVKINTSTGAMTGYDSWPSGFVKGANAFYSGVYDGNGNVWMIPYGADRVVKINTTTGAMTGYDSWPTGFTKASGSFIGGAFDGRYIWMAPCNASQIVRVDTVDGSMKAYNQWTDLSGYTKGANAFYSGAFDGESVWMIPMRADRAVKISSNTTIKKLTLKGDTIPLLKHTVSGAQGSFDVDVWMQSSTDKWTVHSDSLSWLTVSPTSGTGNQSFTVLCQPNSGNERTGNIIVTDADGKERTIRVMQREAIMWTNYDKMTVPAALASYDIAIHSDIAWTASTNSPSWLTISAANGGPSGTLTISCQANTNPSERSGTITLNSGKVEITILVTQLVATMEVDPETIRVPAATGSFDIEIDSDLEWNASTSHPAWLGIATNTGGPNGTLTVTYTDNTGGVRSGRITLTSGGVTRTVDVTQDAPVMAVSLDSKTVTYPAGSFEVELTTNTTWSVSYSPSTASSWLSIAPSSGSGDETLTVSYSANAGVGRAGMITITGNGVSKTIAVTQNAGPYLTTTPADTAEMPSAGGNVIVTVNSNVNWTASSDATTWLNVNAPTSGSNNGSFTVVATPNSGAERRGTITVTSPDGVSETIVFTQATNSPNLVVSPTDIDVTADAGSENVTVTSNVFWSITSAPTWVDILPTAGNNNGSFTVTYEANTRAERSGTITVSGGGLTRTIDITQAAGVAPTVTIDTVTYNYATSKVTVTGSTSNATGYAGIYGAPTLLSADWTLIVSAALKTDGSFSVTFDAAGDEEFYRALNSATDFTGTLTGNEAYSTNVGGRYTVELEASVPQLVANQFDQQDQSLSALFSPLERYSTVIYINDDGDFITAERRASNWSNDTLLPRGTPVEVNSFSDATVVICGTLEAELSEQRSFTMGEDLFTCSTLPLSGDPADPETGLGMPRRGYMMAMQLDENGDTIYVTARNSGNWPQLVKVELGEAFYFTYEFTDETWQQELLIPTDDFQLEVEFHTN